MKGTPRTTTILAAVVNFWPSASGRATPGMSFSLSLSCRSAHVLEMRAERTHRFWEDGLPVLVAFSTADRQARTRKIDVLDTRREAFPQPEAVIVDYRSHQPIGPLHLRERLAYHFCGENNGKAFSRPCTDNALQSSDLDVCHVSEKIQREFGRCYSDSAAQLNSMLCTP